MFGQLYHFILYQPLFNLFVWLYNVIPGHDLGLVILAITLLMRLALYPLTSSGIRAQKALQDLQPKLEAIKQQHPNDKQAQAQATMEIYRTNKVNPFASCLPLLLQLPILLALYQVLSNGLVETNLGAILYPFIHNPGSINPISFGLLNLSRPNVVLALLAGAAQYWQVRGNIRQRPKPITPGNKDENMMAMMNKQMLYMMPALTAFIGFSIPAGLTLYWLSSTILMIGQQYLVNRQQRNGSGASPQPPSVIEGTIVS